MDFDDIKSFGKSVARGVPQMATGFVDLAALPLEWTGVIEPGQAVGGTEWMTKKGLLPPEQKGFVNETTELLGSALAPAGLVKNVGTKGAALAKALRAKQ